MISDIETPLRAQAKRREAVRMALHQRLPADIIKMIIESIKSYFRKRKIWSNWGDLLRRANWEVARLRMEEDSDSDESSDSDNDD